MEKKVLFYVIIVVFVATAAVTLLGLAGRLAVKDTYMPALVAAFLVESAGAVIAVFRRADFFPEKPDGLAVLQKDLEEAKRARTQAETQLSISKSELADTRSENEKLAQAIAALKSLRLRVLAVLGARSADARGVANELQLGTSPVDLADVQAVIGQLESEQEIEPDNYTSAGHYRRRKR